MSNFEAFTGNGIVYDHHPADRGAKPMVYETVKFQTKLSHSSANMVSMLVYLANTTAAPRRCTAKAELAFTYQNDKLKGRVEEFATQLGHNIVLRCDVAEDTSIDTMFAELGKFGRNLTVSYTLLVCTWRSAGW